MLVNINKVNRILSGKKTGKVDIVLSSAIFFSSQRAYLSSNHWMDQFNNFKTLMGSFKGTISDYLHVL